MEKGENVPADSLSDALNRSVVDSIEGGATALPESTSNSVESLSEPLGSKGEKGSVTSARMVDELPTDSIRFETLKQRIEQAKRAVEQYDREEIAKMTVWQIIAKYPISPYALLNESKLTRKFRERRIRRRIGNKRKGKVPRVENKGVGRYPVHWHTREAAKRREERRGYQSRRKRPESSIVDLRKSFRKAGVTDFTLTLEEWTDLMDHTDKKGRHFLRDYSYRVRRYDTSKGVHLDNIYVEGKAKYQQKWRTLADGRTLSDHRRREKEISP